MRRLTDEELRRQIRMDQGDSYNLHLPDGTVRGTGFTAEGPHNHEAEMLAAARRIYDQWYDEQQAKDDGGFVLTFDARVTLEGKPFIAILVNDDQVGQLSPGEVQTLGLRAIQSGIEAERDAGFFKFMRSMDGSQQGLQAAGAMLAGLRDHRQQFDPQA